MWREPGKRRLYGFFYGDGRFYRSDDGGRTWTRTQVAAIAGPYGRGPLQLVVHPTDPDTLLAAGEEGLLRSQEGGRRWETILSGAVTAAAFVPADPQQRLGSLEVRPSSATANRVFWGLVVVWALVSLSFAVVWMFLVSSWVPAAWTRVCAMWTQTLPLWPVWPPLCWHCSAW